MARKTQIPWYERDLPFADYRRVSRQGPREDERFRSPEFQAKLNAEAARRYGVELVPYPVELDVSGSTPARAVLEEIVEAIEDGRLGGLIVPKLDRLSRLRPRDRVMLFERIEDAGGAVLSASEQIDPTTPEGRFARDVFLGVARMQWERYAEGFDMAKREAVERGAYLSKTPPFGYSFGDGRKLVPNDTAPIVREAFRMAARGKSLRQVQTFIHARTGKRMDPRSIRHMLRNRAYLGHSVLGRHENLKAHKPLVTKAEWNKAQRKPANGGLKRTGTRSLLAGIARCGTCGRKMGSSASGAGIRVYRCPRNTGTGEPCSAPASIKEEWLDVFVIEAVRSWARGEGLEDRVIEARSMEDELGAARSALMEAEADRDDWAVTSAGLPRETQRKGLLAREEAVQRAADVVASLEAADAGAVVRTTLRAMWPTLTTPERRLLIASVVERVSVLPLSAVGSTGRAARVKSRAEIVWR